MARAKDTRTLILEGARKVISKKGIQSATMRNIADEVQLSTGALYHYFKSKEEILYAVMDESLPVYSQIATKTRSGDMDRDKLLSEIFDSINKRLHKNQENRVQFYLAHEAIMGDKEIKEKFKLKYNEWIERTSEIIAALYLHPSSRYANAIASLLVGAIDGYVMQLLLGANTADREDIKKVYELLIKEGIPRIITMLQDEQE